MDIKNIDLKLINWLRTAFLPLARIALFIIFFGFGLLKLLDLSPAGPIAEALVAQTIGAQHFDWSYKVLAVFECLIGVLFLFPKLTRLVVPLLILHMIMVSSPLLLVTDKTWDGLLVPTLEGQYIIKNVAVVALAIGVAAQTPPLRRKA